MIKQTIQCYPYYLAEETKNCFYAEVNEREIGNRTQAFQVFVEI
jgi:hypothetical protein